MENNIKLTKVMFPNETYYQQLNKTVKVNNKRTIKSIISIIILTIVIISLSFLFKEQVQTIIINSWIYLAFFYFIIVIPYFNNKKKFIYNHQYNELLNYQNENKIIIELHDNYNKFNKVWRSVYSLIVFLAFYSTTSLLFDEIRNKKITYGPIIILYIILAILIIPTVILNGLFYKKYYNKQMQLIEKDNKTQI